MSLSQASAHVALDAAFANASHVQLHTGNPGTAGTANVWSSAGRQSATFGAASNRTLAMTNQPQWTAAASATPSWVSVWTAALGGTFVGAAPITSPVALVSGDEFKLVALTFSLPA